MFLNTVSDDQECLKFDFESVILFVLVSADPLCSFGSA